MLFRSKLSRKGVLFLLVPLCFQLVLIGWLIGHFEQVEIEAEQANRAREVSNTVNQLVKDVVEIGKVTDIDSGTLGAAYLLLKTDIEKSLEKLRSLLKDQPKQQLIAKEAASSAEQFLQVLEAAHKVTDPEQLKEYKSQYRQIKRQTRDLLTSKLIPLAEEQRTIANIGFERHEQYRAQTRIFLFSLMVLNVVLTIIVVWAFSQMIVNRLERIVDNCMRFASHQPLNKELPGSDEIAQLDHVIHEMADSVNEMTARERTLIDNATDVICSLDRKGAFLEVNKACTSVFGYEQEEIVRNKVVALMSPDDEEYVLERLDAATRAGAEVEFETKLVRKTGAVINVNWSVFWSDSEEKFFCVVHDVTERRRAENLKQEVMQMVSHDLKTPLGTISTFIQMLQEGVLGSLTDTGERLLKTAAVSSTSMLRLIQELLDIEKLDSGLLHLDKQTVLVSSVFERVNDIVKAEAGRKEIELTFEDTSVVLHADPDRLVQVLVNLLSNAIKFSPNNSAITICAVGSPESVQFKVIDRGRGIPSKLKEAIFDRFSQVRVSDAKLKGGSGLGLAISKALVELHGGTIWVESEEGVGSTFHFSIPANETGSQ